MRLLGRGLFFDFDEFVFAARSVDDFLDRLATTFQHGIGDAAGVQTDRTRRVVITRDELVHAFRAVVGIDHANHRDTQLVGFGHGNLVIADVDQENSVR